MKISIRKEIDLSMAATVISWTVARIIRRRTGIIQIFIITEEVARDNITIDR